jgi:hypothetical protein
LGPESARKLYISAARRGFAESLRMRSHLSTSPGDADIAPMHGSFIDDAPVEADALLGLTERGRELLAELQGLREPSSS